MSADLDKCFLSLCDRALSYLPAVVEEEEVRVKGQPLAAG